MEFSAAYTVFLSTLIAILISGCSSDTDPAKVSQHQYRSQASTVTLISDDSDHAVTLLNFAPGEENIGAPAKTYSF